MKCSVTENCFYKPPPVESGYWDNMIASGKNSVCKDLNLNDDLMQEGRIAVWKAFKRIGMFENEMQVKSLVYIIARKRAINFVVKWFGEDKIKESFPWDSFFDIECQELNPEDIFVCREEIKDRMDLLYKSCSQYQYDSFYARYIDDMKFNDIANLTGRKNGNVSCRTVQRAEKFLREYGNGTQRNGR